MTSRLTSCQKTSVQSRPSTLKNIWLTQFQQNIHCDHAALPSGTGGVAKDGPGTLTLAPAGTGHRGKRHLLRESRCRRLAQQREAAELAGPTWLHERDGHDAATGQLHTRRALSEIALIPEEVQGSGAPDDSVMHRMPASRSLAMPEPDGATYPESKRGDLRVSLNGHDQSMTLRRKLHTPIGLAILILAVPAYAQTLPNAGSLLNQQQIAPQPRAPQATTPEEVIPSEAAPGVAEPEAGPSVTLKSITFDGDKSVADAEDLQPVTASMVGKKLTHAGLQKIADTITQYLRGRGYALAYAYLAPQDLTAGNLVITIVEGRLESGKDRVSIHGTTRSSNERIAAIANAALPTDRPLKKEDLERALLLINDRPGVSAKAILQKGAQPGTSKLLIQTTPTPIVNGLLSVDNYGNRSTGIERGTATFFVNDPLGMGDQVTLGLSKSQGTEVANLGYSLPLTPTGLTLLLGGSYLHYRVVQEAYSALDLRGSAVTGSAGLNYPILRTRTQNLNATVMYDYKYLKDSALEVNLSKRKLDNLTFSLSGNRYDGLLQGGVTEGRAAVTFGHVDLSGNPVDQLADSMTAGTQGTFTKLTANFSRLQTLDQNWSVYGGWAGQLSNTNLDSSEKFLLGGPTGVRGYPVGEGSGDEGWMGTVELRRFVNIGVPSVKVQALGFVDVGQIRLHHTTYAGSQINEGHTNKVTLTSAGLGVNAWSGRWNAHVAVARTIGRNDGASLTGNNADGLNTSWRAWLQLGMAF